MWYMLVYSIWMIFICATPGVAYMYKYVDQDGNVRITDNLAVVPEVYRENVDTMVEIKSSSRKLPADKEARSDAAYTSAQRAVSDQTINKAKDNVQVETDGQALVLEGDELHKLYEQIEADKNNLNPPHEPASRMERRVYQQQVIDLNLRIEDYQARVKAYREKVEAYNQRMETITP